MTARGSVTPKAADTPDPCTLMRGAHRRGDEALLLATVSGIATTNPGMIEWFAGNTEVRIITTKSIQVDPNSGNREPVITEPQRGCFGNAVGLRNPGLAAARREFEQVRGHLEALETETGGPRPYLNISLAGRDAAEFALLARELAPLADMLELNLSCPHAHGGYGSVIGCDPRLVEECTAAATGGAALAAAAAAAEATASTAHPVPVFVKLTPNVDSLEHLGAIARRAIAAGAAGIVAINTVGPDQYREPQTGAVILNNPAPAGTPEMSGRGGRSGSWIRERALECVREVRRAIGPDVPLIGMGGVESREDALAMGNAGADVVGIGSALALVHQRDWPQMLRTLARGGRAPDYRREGAMSFLRHTVAARREIGGGLFELELAGELPFEVGQSCFLWLPEIGEKPFSPALAQPATFLIRRRGPFTEALGLLEPGDSLFVRGPYGEGDGVMDSRGVERVLRQTGGRTVAPSSNQTGGSPHPHSQPGGTPPPALILSAGSGTALVPKLAEQLWRSGAAAEVWIGLRDEVHTVPLEEAIRRHATLTAVRDEGSIGRVLSVAEKTLQNRTELLRESGTLWAIGPDPFMEGALAMGDRLGIPRQRMRISREQEMQCGVGLCGMCHYRGELTCRYGTFGEASR